MNTTARRIVLSAPAALALISFGIGTAQAAPYQPSDVSQIQPAADKPDIVIKPGWDIDPDAVGPDDVTDVPTDPTPDPPAPTDAPPASDDDSDDSDDSDGSSHHHSTSGGSNSSHGSTGGSVAPKTDAADEPTVDATDESDQTEAVEVADVAKVDRPFPTGVVALLIGGLLLGGAAWASYRAGNKMA